MSNPTSKIDQMMAAREQRRAQEAARKAEAAAHAARMEAEARALAEERRKLDEERAAREATRARLEAEAAALESENLRLEQTLREEHENRLRQAEEDRRLDLEEAAQRQRLAAEAKARQEAREHLEAEEQRLSAEREALAAAAAQQFENERLLRLAEQEIEEGRRREAEEKAARAAQERQEMEEIDRRLEERAVRARITPAPRAPDGTRRKARLRVSASVLVDHGGTLVALPLVNVSMTGGLIATEGHDFTRSRVGSMLLITLVDNDDAKHQVDLVSRVVRHGENELAVDWSQDENAAHGIARLLDDLSEEPEDQHAAAESRRKEIDEIDQRLESLVLETMDEAPVAIPADQPRRKARLQLAASMLIEHDGSMMVLPLVNVSRTGGLIVNQGSSLATRRVGALLLMALVDSEDEARRVDLLARVVRHDGDTTAVDWSQDEAAAYDIARLLDELAQPD